MVSQTVYEEVLVVGVSCSEDDGEGGCVVGGTGDDEVGEDVGSEGVDEEEEEGEVWLEVVLAVWSLVGEIGVDCEVLRGQWTC